MKLTLATKGILITITCFSSLLFTSSYATSHQNAYIEHKPQPSAEVYSPSRANDEHQPELQLGDGESVFVPWVVWIQGAKGRCSGVAYNQWWAVTAKHCVEPKSVYFPNEGTATYDEVAVQRYIPASDDIQLIRLARPKRLWSYPEFDPNSHPKLNEITTIYGYGGNGSLSQLNGKVIWENAYANSITAKLLDGRVISGDSGSPLLINGKVVAILFGGPKNLAGATTLSAAKQIFEENGVSGIYDVILNTKQQIEFKVSKTLFNSDNKVVVWVDGKYRASMQNGKAKYIGLIADDGDNKIIKLTGSYSGMSYIQIGVVPGNLDHDSAGKPEEASIIVQKMLDGVESVMRERHSQAINVKLSTALFNSPDKTVISFKGKYKGESQNGKVYYGKVIATDNHTTTLQFTPNNANKVAEWVQIEWRHADKNNPGTTLSQPLYEGVISTLVSP